MPVKFLPYATWRVNALSMLSQHRQSRILMRSFVSKTESDASQLSESIKNLMRGSAQSVAIVSAFLPEDEKHVEPRFLHAATLSSFTTVCLSPPMVAFSIRQPSRIADALRDGAAILEYTEHDSPNGVRHASKRPHFLVHLLSSHQSSISDYFARPGAEPYEVAVASEMKQVSHPFELHPIRPSQTVDRQFILQEAMGTMACSLVYQLDLTSPDLHGTTHFEAHKHVHEPGSILFIAQIHAVELGHKDAVDSNNRPLVYWNRKYCVPSEAG
ncbi:hypothetical protein MPSI1_003983 [Malassezia psittaci]|uniref:Flavin reductase like domain-containing protein n=1 Tax=Malassezia psittaci TaxID=1821823 RepID=A0AAF0JMP7_9BASI|nr:hypothetical protein MPSI1_003983 [Malassezia psittaci]